MNLAPLAIQQFFDNNGNPAVGFKLFTYAAGTTTKLATYIDSGGLTPNTNPIVLNFRGEARIWIDPTLSYKFTLAPSTDTDPPGNPIWTVDNITAGPASMDNAAIDTGGGNNVLLSIPNLPSTPSIFTRIVWKAAATNSGAMTIAINGGATKNLLTQELAAMQSQSVRQNGIYQAIYDGTQWQTGIPVYTGVLQYTGTLTQCTTAPTGQISYSLIGNLVLLDIPSITATSANTNQPTITGMPAAIWPANQQVLSAVVYNNSVPINSSIAIGTNGVISLFNTGLSALFTAAGTKGINAYTVLYRRL